MEGLTIFLGILLVFLLINFNRDLGLIFTLMLVLDWMMFANKKWISYPMERDPFRGKDVLFGIMAYVAFILLSSVMAGILVGGSALANPLQSVFASMQATTPVLAESKILMLIGWGILIPIVETRFFFGRMMEWISYKLKERLQFRSIKTWLIFIFVSFIFTIFHLTARSITKTSFDNTALMLTFLFGMISCALVVYRKELSSATYFHICSNTVATLLKIGWKPMSVLLGL